MTHPSRKGATPDVRSKFGTKGESTNIELRGIPSSFCRSFSHILCDISSDILSDIRMVLVPWKEATLKKKKAGGGLGGRAQRLPPRCIAPMHHWRPWSFLHMRQNITRASFLFCLPLTQLMFQGFSFDATTCPLLLSGEHLSNIYEAKSKATCHQFYTTVAFTS